MKKKIVSVLCRNQPRQVVLFTQALPPKEKQKHEEILKAYNDLNNALGTLWEKKRKQKEEALLTLKTTILNLQQAGFDNAKIIVLLGKTEKEITQLLA